MGKQKRQAVAIQKRIAIPAEETTSLLEVHFGATSASMSSSESGAKLAKFKDDSTNAPKLGELEEEKVEYASSYPELLDKYALSKWPFSKIFVFGVLGWIILQDNGAGNLANWNGIFWMLQKSGIVLALFILVFLVHSGYKRFFSRP